MRYRILAGLSALLVAGGVVVAASAQQAGASQEFTLTAVETNFEFAHANEAPIINPGPSTPAPESGDRFLLRETLTENGTTVGYDNIVCTDTFNNNGLCDALFAFTGQGDIHATALVRDLFDTNSNGPTVFDASIDGGTFAYSNATGSIHLTNLPDGNTQDEFLIN
jgi:hypothetical protein